MATPSSYYCAKCQTEVDSLRAGTNDRCEDCGQWLVPRYQPIADHLGNVPMTSVVEHAAVGTQTSGANEARRWRIERYLELGFDADASERLADTRDSVRIEDRHGESHTWVFPLNWQHVAAAIGRDCSHELAVAIFT